MNIPNIDKETIKAVHEFINGNHAINKLSSFACLVSSILIIGAYIDCRFELGLSLSGITIHGWNSKINE